MYTIPLIVMAVSLVVIIIIVFRHIQDLANLSVESIPSVREAQFKEEIISKRLKRGMLDKVKYFASTINPAVLKLNNYIKTIVYKIHESRAKITAKKMNGVSLESEKIEDLFNEVDELIKDGNFDECEKKLINILELDYKNIDAFASLGQIYFEKKNYNEAKQTLEHVIKLEPNNDEIYFDLALVCKAMNNNDGWYENLKKAQKINENNPRYLDSLLEVLIVIKDKVKAKEIYDQLMSVNSDNAKLDQFKKEIENM